MIIGLSFPPLRIIHFRSLRATCYQDKVWFLVSDWAYLPRGGAVGCNVLRAQDPEIVLGGLVQ